MRRMMSLHAAKFRRLAILSHITLVRGAHCPLHIARGVERNCLPRSASMESSTAEATSTSAQPLALIPPTTVFAQGNVAMERAPAGALPALQRVRRVALCLPLPAPGRPVERLWWC